MIKNVIKRDKSLELFDFNKVVEAVTGAFKSVKEDIPADLENRLEFIKDLEDKPKVEKIQDILEEYLIKHYYNVGKAFMLYRHEHKIIRDDNNKLTKDIAAKLRAENVENQNANVDEYSFGGRIGEASRIVTKKFALDNCMSKMSKRNHDGNMIYIHDLDSYAVGLHNCLTCPMDDLLKDGFSLRQSDVRGANSVNTAMQLIAVIFQIQSLQQFGGVSASTMDWTMVPYVRKSFTKHLRDGIRYLNDSDYEFLDDYLANRPENGMTPYQLKYWRNPELAQFSDKALEERYPEAWEYAMDQTKKELYQAVEGLYHNLNTLQSRSGNQLPFSSLNTGTCTVEEGRLVSEALLDGCIRGIGKFHRTSIFPCLIWQYKKGVNDRPGTPNYDLYLKALYSTARRIYPNYVNVDWSGNAGYDPDDPRTYMSTMGCRTCLGMDINGFGQQKTGRGNICPVTIIMPTLAVQAGRDVEKFMKLLDKKIFEAKDMLIERFEYICSQSPKSAQFMYENGSMNGYVPEEGIRSALKHGTLAIGQLGLNETLTLLLGKNHTTPEGMELAKKIESLFKQRCAEFKNEYKLNFGVYYTPAEGLCYTAMKKFRAKYGVIEGVSDKEYFTNSIHVPVYQEMSPFDKIDIESQLTGYSNAGCITYVELPSTAYHNIEALEELVNYAMDKDIPYFAINSPNDTCENCGAQGEFNDVCPECGSDRISRLRRVTGYITGNYTTAFNWGKQKETEDRINHTSQEVETES